MKDGGSVQDGLSHKSKLDTNPDSLAKNVSENRGAVQTVKKESFSTDRGKFTCK